MIQLHNCAGGSSYEYDMIEVFVVLQPSDDAVLSRGWPSDVLLL